MKKINNKLFVIILIVVVVVAVLLTRDWDLKHIEDTNGPDNYALTTITQQDIIDNEMGSLKPYHKRDALIGDAIVVSSNKFTGVYEILSNNYMLNSDFVLHLYDFEIQEGNFTLAVVHDGQIVATGQPNEFREVDIHLEDINGPVSIMIAGESASYSFKMSQIDYESFRSHMEN